MRPPSRLAAPLLALALAACGTPPDFHQAPPPPAVAAACDAKLAGFAVGQPYTEAVADEARRNSGASVVRPLRPNQPVTLEYNAQRLNLDLDGAGRITQARCG